MHHCNEQDVEWCSVHLKYNFCSKYVLAAHRAFRNTNLIPTAAIEIKNIIQFFKSNQSCDYEGMSTKFLKSCADYISTPLS